jgi:shikimate dehydrogenase
MSIVLAGVVGWPVTHSLSPRLHRYWLDELRIDGAYVPLAAARSDFAKAIDVLSRAGFVGVNVTVPHKHAALAFAHVADKEAQRAGAANLLLFHSQGRIEARNTDIAGLRASLLAEIGAAAFTGATASVIGAGGAARAAVLALGDLGVAKIFVLNRTPSRGKNLAFELQSVVSAELIPCSWPDWLRVAEQSAIIVNATTAGMVGNEPLDLPLDALRTSATVVDLVYNPSETPLLKQARARRLKAINGLGMLMQQAVPSFAAFYGVTPTVTPELRQALEKALTR